MSVLLRYTLSVQEDLLEKLEIALEPWILSSLRQIPEDKGVTKESHITVSGNIYTDEIVPHSPIWYFSFWCFKEKLPPEGWDSILRRAFPELENLEIGDPILENPTKNWSQDLQASFPPQQAGLFTIADDHIPMPQEKKAPHFWLKINAQGAFGTGQHPTTQACLRLLSFFYTQSFRPRRILDVGCGSGILSIAAHRLFPHAHFVAVDIAPEALEICRHNAEKNDVPPKVFKLLLSQGPLPDALYQEGPFDLIMANLLLRPLIALAPSLESIAASRALFLLSGLLDHQVPDLYACYRQYGIHTFVPAVIDHWQACGLQKGH